MPLVLDSDLQANWARELDAHIAGLVDDLPPAPPPMPMPVPADQADRQATAAPPPAATDISASASPASVQTPTAPVGPTLPSSTTSTTPQPQTSPSDADQFAQHIKDLTGGAVDPNAPTQPPSQPIQTLGSSVQPVTDDVTALADHIKGVTGGQVDITRPDSQPYTVQPGDTLSGIAGQFYGDSNAYPPLAAANSIPNPNQIQAGQQLRIPPSGGYVVQPGDTLSGIAQRTLGDANQYGEIASASGVANPNVITPGQRLTIPGGGQASAPTASQSWSYTSGGAPLTTAELSGGGRFAGIGDNERALLVDAGTMARQAGYGDQGARALQSVLMTEGGLSGAAGDNGQSKGPLQFYGGGGQLNNFARQNGMTLQQAGDYVTQNPRAAVQWALGTPDQPGYLGAALLSGQHAGLSGADLATYVQQHGQVSVSPERAGQYHNLLFGNGQDPFSSSAQTQQQTVGDTANSPGGAIAGPGLEGLGPPPLAGGAADRQDRIGAASARPSQFGMGLSDADAYAACGPAAAIAFARAYGRNPTTDEAMTLARASGWDAQTGMKGVASEQALLGRLGVATKLEQNVDWNHVTQEAAGGNPVVISTPGHYFFVDGTQQSDNGQTLYHVGTSGTDLRGGAEWMTAADMQRRMGQAQGALYADHPLAEAPSLAEPSRAPLIAPPQAQGQPQRDTGLGGAFATIAQKAGDLTNAVQSFAQDPGAAVRGAADAVGGAVSGAADAVGGAVPDLSGRLPILQMPQPDRRLLGPDGAPIGPDPNANVTPIARQAAGLPTNPFDVSSQIGEVGSGLVVPDQIRDVGVGPFTVGNIAAQALSPAWQPGIGAADLAAQGVTKAVGSVAGPVIRAGAGRVAEAVSPALRQAGESIAGAFNRLWPQRLADLQASPVYQQATDATQSRLATAVQQGLSDELQAAPSTVSGVASEAAAPAAAPVAAAEAQAQAAVDKLRAQFPQMSEGSLAASGPGKALAALKAGAPEATMPPAGAVAPELTRPVTGHAGMLEPEVAATLPQTPAAQPADTTLQGLINVAKSKGFDTSSIEAQLPKAEGPATQFDATTGTWTHGEPPGFNAPLAEQSVRTSDSGGGAPPLGPGAKTTGANPFALATDAVPGRAPLSPDEVVSHLEALDAQHTSNADRILELQTKLEGGVYTPGRGDFTGGVVRPPWAAGWTNEALTQLAKKNDLNPYAADWFEHGNFTPGTGEMRLDVGQSGLKGTGKARGTATAARAELAQLQAQQQQIEAASEHIWGAGSNGTPLYSVESAPVSELPWEYTSNANDATAAARTAGPGADTTGAIAPAGGVDQAALTGGGGTSASARAADAATGPAAAGVAPKSALEQSIGALQQTRQWQAARPIDQVEMVRALAEGRPPIAGAESPSTGLPAQSAHAGQDLYGPTELAAGLNPGAVARSGATVFAPATQAPKPVQVALNQFDSQTRGAAARIDTMVAQGQLTPNTGNTLYSSTKRSGYTQWLNDVANSPDGVMQKGTSQQPAIRPAGWKDGNAFGTELSNVYLSPQVATVVENIRDQVNGNTLADTLGAINKGFGIVKEATLGGSTYHLVQEAMQVTRLTRENAPAVLATSFANAADPTGKLYQAFRTSSSWAPWFERAADAGLTQVTRTPEGEAVDMMRGPAGLAVRAGAGASAGFVKGYLGESDPNKRVEQGLKDAGLGAAFGVSAAYMVPALWDRAVPTMKVMAFRTLAERGMSDAAAATMVNNTIGGENLVRIARSPLVQSVSRAGMFAVDWWTNWGRNLFRALNPMDTSEVGIEAKKYVATTVVTGAIAVEGLNRLFAGHSALENDRDHLADVDMTKVWGPDPKTGQRQYASFLGPVADIINASTNPGRFLEARLGYIPNIASELTTGQTVTGFHLPNVASELSGGKTSLPARDLKDRALSVAAQQFEGLYPAGASSAQSAYQRGGLGAAALSVATGMRATAERPGASAPAANGLAPVAPTIRGAAPQIRMPGVPARPASQPRVTVPGVRGR